MKAKLLLSFIVLLFAPLILWGQINIEKLSPRTAYFVSSVQNEKSELKSKQFILQEEAGIEYISAFIDIDEDADLEELKSLGVLVNTVVPGIITAQIPVEQIAEVQSVPFVKRIEISTPVTPKMDKARLVSNVDYVHEGTDLKNPYTGKDVIVGIVDGGFQYDHINFFDKEGNLRIKRVWAHNRAGNKPAGFEYGYEYNTSASIIAAKQDNVLTTHGCHVAGIAAGSNQYEDNPYYGIATESDLVFVSYYLYEKGTSNTYISDGVKYIFDYAESVGKPCVVNLSLGMHAGPHDGTSAFDRICDALQGEGKLLVGAAGNEGDQKIHLSRNFTAENDTLQSFLTFHDPMERYGEVDIWSDPNKSFYVQVVVHKKNTGVELFSSPLIDASVSGLEEFSLNTAENGATGKISFATERNNINNKSNAYIVVNLTGLNTGNYIGIRIISKEDGLVNAWTDNSFSYFYGNRIDGWENADSNSTIGEIGGSGNRIITVGAYASKTSYTNIQGKEVSTGEIEGNIATFSSKGPTGDGRMKPDIAAPGSVTISSFGDYLSSHSNVTYLNNISDTNYYYGAMQGTSMAAPVVTGILATWLEAKNNLTPEEVRTVLQKTAIKDGFTSEDINNSWGYGKIDAWAGVKEIEKMKGNNLEMPYSQKDAFLIYPNPAKERVNIILTSKAENINLSIYSLNGQLILSQSTKPIDNEISIDLDGLSKGVYLINLKGNNINQTQRLVIM
ncbi:S8 family peptidase [Bacteroidales bacterium OttesenSCG-928-I14]|nr:S8 family peptidase [Bacteroidales bacterium OttesenSCG-928-I14]